MEWQLQEFIETASRERGINRRQAPIKKKWGPTGAQCKQPGNSAAQSQTAVVWNLPPESRWQLERRQGRSLSRETLETIAGARRGERSPAECAGGRAAATRSSCASLHAWPHKGVSVFLGSVRCYPWDETGGLSTTLFPTHSGRGHTLPRNLPQYTITLRR